MITKVNKPKGGNYTLECLLHPNGVLFCKKHPHRQYCAACEPGCFDCTRSSFVKNPKLPKRTVTMSRSRAARVQPAGPKLVSVKVSELRVGDIVERRNAYDPSEVLYVPIREIRHVRIRVTGGRGYLVLHEPAFYVGSFLVKGSENVAIVERSN